MCIGKRQSGPGAAMQKMKVPGGFCKAMLKFVNKVNSGLGISLFDARKMPVSANQYPPVDQHDCGKSQCLIDKLSINAPLSRAMLVYQTKTFLV